MKKTIINVLVGAFIIILLTYGASLEREINDLTLERDTMEVTIEELKSETIILRLQVQGLNKEIIALEEQIAEAEKEIKIPIVSTTSKHSYDYDYVLRVVAAECRGEPIEGQMAVAQTIMETSKVTGMTPEQVVKVPNQYASPISIDLVNDSVKEACERVLVNGESVTNEPIRYFYSTMDGFVSKWHENSLEYVMTIGNHKFFKAKGK